MTVTIVSDGTIREGPSGTVGTKLISKRYPIEEGLEAGTTKQTKVPYLEEGES
jgi:hypothetical protein